MKSRKYIKHRRSKYDFPTQIIKASRGSGGQKRGGVIKGSDKALADIERALDRKVEVHHTEHRLGEWVFAELKPETKEQASARIGREMFDGTK